MAAGRLTSLALVEHLLARIEALEPRLHALVAVSADARAQAQAADARRRSGQGLGPLDGVPVIIKDNIEALGLPATVGSLAMVGAPAQRDATLVTRLREAGLVILAAANLSEWANMRGRSSTSGWSGVGGLTDNPWQAGRSAGGSSSGCGAALAAGYAPLAVGTETDGSITCPASLCGVVGFKPTVGTVPVHAVAPIAASQDSPGPMARSMADVTALLAVLTGAPPAAAPPESLGSRRFVLGVPGAWLSGHDPTDALLARATGALRAAGMAIVPVDLPVWQDSVGVDEVSVLVHEMSDDLDAYLANRPGTGPRSIAEVVAFNRAHAKEELEHFGQEYLAAAVASGGRSSDDYAPARARNLAWALDCLHAGFAGGVDALVAPAYGPAWSSDLVGGDRFIGGAMTAAPAIAGWPLLTLPLGLVDALPVGMGMVVPARGEDSLLALGATVESVLSASLGPMPHWRA